MLRVRPGLNSPCHSEHFFSGLSCYGHPSQGVSRSERRGAGPPRRGGGGAPHDRSLWRTFLGPQLRSNCPAILLQPLLARDAHRACSNARATTARGESRAIRGRTTGRHCHASARSVLARVGVRKGAGSLHRRRPQPSTFAGLLGEAASVACRGLAPGRSSRAGVLLCRARLELEAHERLLADNPRLVPGLDHVCLAEAKLRFRNVLVAHAEPARFNDADARRRVPPRANRGAQPERSPVGVTLHRTKPSRLALGYATESGARAHVMAPRLPCASSGRARTGDAAPAGSALGESNAPRSWRSLLVGWPSEWALTLAA